MNMFYKSSLVYANKYISENYSYYLLHALLWYTGT